ncbi:MAG: exodeoxyribonuclease V subunit alpha [Proteobacteria bacterium]|nr:exodeoxyribonuclease V subunit alpha [Pseudomonadota bacterium]MBU1709920.1 exodeoxyribonuclease V subunit alpha [Pseudomonadota bacterium]
MDTLKQLTLDSFDRHFAGFINRIAKKPGDGLLLGAALVSYYTRNGHACLDLSSIAGKPLPRDLVVGDAEIHCPGFEAWLADLTASGVVGRPGDSTPLIIQPPQLYLQRFWNYETQISEFILQRSSIQLGDIDPEELAKGLDRLFPHNADKTDWQRVAAFTAVSRRFCVITGGPGTGKTSTAAKIIALLIYIAAARGEKAPKIMLAAPTGKAASRMQDALKCLQQEIVSDAAGRYEMPEKVTTLHRLLGAGVRTGAFKYHSENQLPADTVIIDEASMVDISLMFHLMEALPANCRLILMGDRDQLASVEPGAILADIAHRTFSEPFSEKFILEYQNTGGRSFQPEILLRGAGLHDSVVELKENYRFKDSSGIRILSQAINRQEPDLVMEVLSRKELEDIAWKEFSSQEEFEMSLAERVHDFFPRFEMGESPRDALNSLGRFGILCAHRKGRYGAMAVNALIERILEQTPAAGGGDYYVGRPVMVAKNHYGLGLFNGDVGVVFEDSEALGKKKVYFRGSDGSERKFMPELLPEHDTCYAITVHKGQGSEFDHVLLILPEAVSPVLTCELIYTAVTRARSSVEIWGGREILREAIQSKVNRQSGLLQKLE